MPKIATYGEPQVQTEVAKGARASELPLSAFPLAHYGKALGDVATAAQTIQTRIGTTQAEEELVSFERAKNDILFNPKTGYFNTQGKTAFDQSAIANESLQNLMRSHADRLKDPIARDAFMKVAERHITSSQQSIMQHASKGLSAWEVATIKAQIENVFENASLYRNDEKQLSVQRELGRRSVIEVAQREGIDGEGIDGDALNERLQNFESSFASATISTSISDGAKQGKAAFEKYADRLEEQDKVKLKDELEKKQKSEHTAYIAYVGVTAGRSIADKFYTQGLDAARAEIDKKYKDPEANRAVTNETISEFRRKDYMKQRSEVDALDKAEGYLLSATTDNPRTVNGLKAEHPEVWAALDPKQQRNLESGVATVTDHRVLNDIRSLTMDQLATLNIAEYADRLSTADRKEVIKMVENARAGKYDIELQSDAALIKAKTKQYGLNDEEQQAAIEAVGIELNKAVNAKGEALTPKDRMNIITNSLSSFRIERGFFKGGDREFDVENTPVAELGAMNLVAKQLTSRLPAADANRVKEKIAGIRDLLIEQDIPVNRGNILAAYLNRYPIKREGASKADQIPR